MTKKLPSCKTGLKRFKKVMREEPTVESSAPLNPVYESTLEAALDLRRRGFNVLPLRGDSKSFKQPAIPVVPLRKTPLDELQLTDRFKGDPRNVGIITGAPVDQLSGNVLLVLDADNADSANWVKENISDSTIRALTGKGTHFYFQVPASWQIGNAVGKDSKLDVRCAGGYVVAPGSYHFDKDVRYRWDTKLDADLTPTWTAADVERLLWQQWLQVRAYVGLPGSDKDTPPFNANYAPIKGERNDCLYKSVCHFIGKGWTEELILADRQKWNKKLCPPIPKAEFEKTFRSAIDGHNKNHPDQVVRKTALDPGSRIRFPELNAKGKPLNGIVNLKSLLDHHGATARYNIVSKRDELVTPGNYGLIKNGQEASRGWVSAACTKVGLGHDRLKVFLTAIAAEAQYSPVVDWIKSASWDGSDYIKRLCDTVTAEAGFPSDFKEILITKWLISAVALAFNDDGHHWSKGVLVFQGDQNVGKTSWFRELLPAGPRINWAKEGYLLRPDNKDSVIGAIRSWLVELGEIDGTFKKSDINMLKAFLPLSIDTFRLPYAETESCFPRTTCFFGSVNSRQFLNDETGNSRFWTVPVIALDFNHNIDTQQLWAQAYHLFKGGRIWHLTGEEEKQLNRLNQGSTAPHPVEEKIFTWVVNGCPGGETEMSASEVLSAIGYDKPSKGDRNATARVLREIYGEAKIKRLRGARGRYFQITDFKETAVF